MIDFNYTAKTTAGAEKNGVINAASIAEARQLLRSEGLFPMSLAPASGSHSVGKARGKTRQGRVSKADLLMVTSQLSIMLKAGVDLADALNGVASECRNAPLRKALRSVYDAVSSGETVSAALEKHSHIFGSTYVVAIRAGEASGQMTEVTERLTKLLRYEIRLSNNIKGMMTYPVILFSVAFMVTGALLFFVLPQFATVFAGLDKPVPPSTQFLLDASMFVRSHYWIVLPGIVATVILAWKMRHNSSVRLMIDRMLLKTRGIGPAVQGLSCGRLFTLMGTMLQSGIPLLDTLVLCQTASSNLLIRQLFVRLEDDVINGRGISAGLATTDCIPNGAAQMILTAEGTGRLAEVIATVGEFYEEEGERQIRQAVKILEPVIILSMGVFVSFIVMSIMLPLLDVTDIG